MSFFLIAIAYIGHLLKIAGMSIVNKTAIARLTKKDELFTMILDLYGPPPNWQREPGFASLAKIILEQQISLAAANAHFQKLTEKASPFTPASLLLLSDTEMRDAHISKQKTTYLRALATAISTNQLDLAKLPSLEEMEVRNRLTQIKGIGQWTSDIYLMFCLQSQDIFPTGDIALINTIRALTPAKSKEEITAHTAKWKPFRSLAAYFLWHYYLKKKRTVP